MNGDAVYTIIGADSSLVCVSFLLVSTSPCLTCLANISPTVPPATLRKAEPASPSKNLAISIVCIFGATAHGISQIRKNVNEPM